MPDHAPNSVLDLFRSVADEVAAAVAVQVDWGESGHRDGQYAADLVADDVVVGRLLSAGLAVLSEESGPQGPDGAPVVVVDPIDGSTNASRRIPWFATALCLVDDTGPLVALVRNHGTGDEFTAVRGEGARCGGRLLRVGSPVPLHDAIVGVSGLPAAHLGWRQFRALGAAAPDICAVADGVLDAWCDMSVDAHGVWDYLAAVLVLTEAGGVATDVHDRDLVTLDHAARRTPVVASSGPLLDELLVARR